MERNIVNLFVSMLQDSIDAVEQEVVMLWPVLVMLDEQAAVDINKTINNIKAITAALGVGRADDIEAALEPLKPELLDLVAARNAAYMAEEEQEAEEDLPSTLTEEDFNDIENFLNDGLDTA